MSETSKVTYMDVAEFRRLGLLQEINRRILHPLGLALEVNVTEDGTERLSGIWDCRDDPEGISYSPEVYLPEKHWRFEELWGRCREERVKRLGYMVQPLWSDPSQPVE